MKPFTRSGKYLVPKYPDGDMDLVRITFNSILLGIVSCLQSLFHSDCGKLTTILTVSAQDCGPETDDANCIDRVTVLELAHRSILLDSSFHSILLLSRHPSHRHCRCDVCFKIYVKVIDTQTITRTKFSWESHIFQVTVKNHPMRFSEVTEK